MLSDLNRLVHKDILPSWTPSGSSAKSYPTTAKPNNCSEHRKIQEGSEHALWVQLALAVCYLPKFIMLLLMMTYRKTYSSHVVIIDGIATI